MRTPAINLSPSVNLTQKKRLHREIPCPHNQAASVQSFAAATVSPFLNTRWSAHYARFVSHLPLSSSENLLRDFFVFSSPPRYACRPAPRCPPHSRSRRAKRSGSFMVGGGPPDSAWFVDRLRVSRRGSQSSGRSRFNFCFWTVALFTPVSEPACSTPE